MDFVNQAGWDRTLRIVIGAAMIYAGWFALAPGLLAATLKIFGLIPLVTGLLGWSPLYAILGFRTAKPHRTRGSSTHLLF